MPIRGVFSRQNGMRKIVHLEFVVSLRHAVKVSFFQNKLNAVDKVEIEIS